MLQSDRFKQNESLFFSFFGIKAPEDTYEIYDLRDLYWSVKEEGQHYHIKYADIDVQDPLYTLDTVHRFKETKGNLYKQSGFTVFQVTYTKNAEVHHYFKVFKNENYIKDYDDFATLLHLKAAQ